MEHLQSEEPFSSDPYFSAEFDKKTAALKAQAKRKLTFVSNSAPKALSKRKHCRFYRILHLIGPSIKSPAAKAKTKDLPRLAKRPGIIKSIEHRKPFEHVLLAPSKRAVPPPTAMPTL